VKSYSDKQIYTFLDRRFLGFNVVAGGGKDQCLRTLEASRGLLAGNPFGVRVFALLDRDLDEEDSPAEGAVHLPVCMVENLLLQPSILREGFGPLLHQTEYSNEEVLKEALKEAINAAETLEVQRRFRRKLRMATFGPDRSVRDAETAREFRDRFKAMLDRQDFESLQAAATTEVAQIRSSGREIALFSGKEILSYFHGRFVSSLMISKAMFVYNCARAAGLSGVHRSFFDTFFESAELVGEQRMIAGSA
jgi:hypothetical protein